MTLASFIHRYEEHGGGDLPAFSWAWDDAPPYAHTGEVDTLDGFVLVLSPWAVRNVRFDESLGRFHGYDLDFCLQVREAGRKVVTADFRAIHHHALEMLPRPARSGSRPTCASPRSGTAACRASAPAPGTWRERALRAEAERDAARRDGAHEGARARGARPRARARHRRDAREPVLAPHRAAARGSAPRDDRLRLRRSPTPRPTGASPRPASGAPPSPTPRSSRSRRSARSAAATTCCSTPPPRTTTSRRSCSSHQHAEIADPGFCAKVREALARPGGRRRRAASARAASRTIAWWEGAVSSGAGRPPLRRARRRRAARLRAGRGPRRRSARSTRVDGFLLVLSPWAVRNAALRRVAAARGHGYDVDFCLQVARGRPQGRDRGPARDPPPLARAGPRTSRSGSRRHIARRREVGRPHGPAATPATATGSAARAAPRPSARPRGRWPTRARHRLDARDRSRSSASSRR